jgi:hypothetical protein
MRYTDDEIAAAAARLEHWADEVDPDSLDFENTDDLRAIADAADAVAAAEARLRETVEIARARGRSWNRIAIPLGTSRQAARQRFDHQETERATVEAKHAGRVVVISDTDRQGLSPSKPVRTFKDSLARARKATSKKAAPAKSTSKKAAPAKSTARRS